MKKREVRLKKAESLLSKKIKDIYQNQLEHKLNRVSYRLFDHTLIVILEGTVTSSEKLLKNNARLGLAEEVRQSIDSVIHPQIRNIIEEILNVKVIDFLSSTVIERDLTGAIAILELKPDGTLNNCKF